MMQSPRYRKCTPALWRGLCIMPLALRLSEELGVFGGETLRCLQRCGARLRYLSLAQQGYLSGVAGRPKPTRRLLNQERKNRDGQ